MWIVASQIWHTTVHFSAIYARKFYQAKVWPWHSCNLIPSLGQVMTTQVTIYSRTINVVVQLTMTLTVKMTAKLPTSHFTLESPNNCDDLSDTKFQTGLSKSYKISWKFTSKLLWWWLWRVAVSVLWSVEAGRPATCRWWSSSRRYPAAWPSSSSHRRPACRSASTRPP